MGSWFPFNYRDVAGWKSGKCPSLPIPGDPNIPSIKDEFSRTECGIDISTTSDEAAKLFDATVAQTVLMDTDKQGPCSVLVPTVHSGASAQS